MTAPIELSTPAAFAQAYARMGWHVLPIEPGSKRPIGALVPRGMLDATTDPDTIARWWSKQPTAGIGIALAQSGLVAVDVDPRNGGAESFDALQAERGSLRSDVMAYTGGGGEHHVFVVPHGHQVSLPGTLGPGIDLKVNGYIVVEPTVHPSGKPYQWEASSSPLDGVAPSPLPDWLRSLRIDQSSTPAAAQPASAPVDQRQLRDVREALYVMDADDHDVWVHAGMALHSTGWGHAAYALWCAWAQQSPKFDATEHRKRWASFHTDGDRSIRLSFIFAQAQRAGWSNPAARLEGVPSSQPSAAGDLPLVWSEDITAEAVRIEQLIEDVITKGGLSVMYGESNSGKSFLACDAACSIGAGLAWLGKRTVRGSVLYVAGEGSESIKLRVLAWRQHHGAEPWLAIVPAAVNLLDPRADLARVEAACRAVQQRYGAPVVLIVIDTLARAFGGGNENASEDMGAVISHADRLRESTGSHVLFVHHSGKDQARGSRGHSSLKGATDTEIEVEGNAELKLHTATIRKQRDLASRGEALNARFNVVRMGTDQWGKPVTTCVVESTNERAPQKSNKARANALHEALVKTLAVAPNRTLKRAELVAALRSQGFTPSPIYRAVADLVAQSVICEVLNRVHLNGSSAADPEASK